MDMSPYISSEWIKSDHLADGPRRDAIDSVKAEAGEYGTKPVATFQGGGKLRLNATSVNALINAWGKESDSWIGKEVEMYTRRMDVNGVSRDVVFVRPISPPIRLSEREQPAPKPQRPLADDMNDDIPF